MVMLHVSNNHYPIKSVTLHNKLVSCAVIFQHPFSKCFIKRRSWNVCGVV